MQIKTALAVYNQLWCIEPQAGLAMLSLWESTRAEKAGAVQEEHRQGSPSFAIMQALQSRADDRVKVAPTDTYDLRSFSFEGAQVAVIPVTGAIMKGDFCDEAGSATLAALVRDADRTKSVKSIVLSIDSPGGAAGAISVLTAAIEACTKPTTAMVSGTCCSAAYFIASACSAGIYATDKLCNIGSIGTMVGWADNKGVMEKSGYKVHEYYATASTEKNAPFREAEAGKPKKLIEQYLDPTNQVFLEAVRESRAGKLPEDETQVLAGQVFLSAQAMELGLIDGMATADEIISSALSQSSFSKNPPKQKMAIVKFGAVMLAMAASQIPLVEGGFLLTEPQLDALDARLSAQADTSLSTQLTEALAATGQLATATARVTELEAQLATANTQIEQLGKLPGSDFKTVQADADPVKPEADALDTASFAHNLAAEAYEG